MCLQSKKYIDISRIGIKTSTQIKPAMMAIQRCPWLQKYIVFTLFLIAVLVAVQIGRKYVGRPNFVEVLPQSADVGSKIAQSLVVSKRVDKETENISTRRVVSEDWAKIFDFVPPGIAQCQELFKHSDKKHPFDERVTAHQGLFLEEVKKFKVTEGYSQYLIEEYMLYYELVRAPFVKTVCETGFNAGHSTFMWLAANANTRVYSFDLGQHGYARPMAAYLNKTYPGRLTVIWGDSTKTIPEFRQLHPDVRCDLIIIDGGHTHDVALADFKNFMPMASSDNILIFDDYPSSMSNFMQTLGSFWEGRKRRAELLEIFQCRFMPVMHRGFSVGRFNI